MPSTKTEFIKNIIFSYSNKITLILSTFAYTYLIANFLGPEKYGIFNYYVTFTTGLLGIFGVAFLQNIISIFTPQYKSEKLFKKIRLLQLGLVILVFAFLFIFSQKIDTFLDKENYIFLKYTAFLLLVFPFYELYKYLFQGFKRFGKVLKTDATLNSSNLILAFLLVVVLNQGIFGALYAKILSVVIGLLFFIYYYKSLQFQDKKVDYSRIKRFGKYAVPNSIARRISGQTYLVLLGYFIGGEKLGFYYIAEKITTAAMGLVTSSFQDVLQPYLGERYRDKRAIGKYTSINIKFMLLLNIAIGIFLTFPGKLFLGLFFPEYIEAYKYIPLFALLYIIRSLSLIMPVYSMINRVEFLLISNILGFLSMVIVGITLMPIFDVYGAILAMIANALVFVSLLFYSLRRVGVEIEVIPRKEDLALFYDILKKGIKKAYP
jgi:O-antigen/teichoic acid export membrane protein